MAFCSNGSTSRAVSGTGGKPLPASKSHFDEVPFARTELRLRTNELLDGIAGAGSQGGKRFLLGAFGKAALPAGLDHAESRADDPDDQGEHHQRRRSDLRTVPANELP